MIKSTTMQIYVAIKLFKSRFTTMSDMCMYILVCICKCPHRFSTCEMRFHSFMINLSTSGQMERYIKSCISFFFFNVEKAKEKPFGWKKNYLNLSKGCVTVSKRNYWSPNGILLVDLPLVAVLFISINNNVVCSMKNSVLVDNPYW